MKSSKPLIIAVVLATLSGCSLLPAPDPVQTWQLQPAPAVNDRAVVMSDLRILRPQAQDLLNGRHMLVVPDNEPVSVYADARWSTAIPNLWRDQLVDVLQRDSRFSRISSDEVRVAARYELVSRLDAFQTEYREGQAQAVMRGYLQLVDNASRAVLAERAFDLREPAAGDELSKVVPAFSALMARMSIEVRDWLLTVDAGH